MGEAGRGRGSKKVNNLTVGMAQICSSVVGGVEKGHFFFIMFPAPCRQIGSTQKNGAVDRKALIDLWTATKNQPTCEIEVWNPQVVWLVGSWELGGGVAHNMLPPFFKESWQKGGEKGMAEDGRMGGWHGSSQQINTLQNKNTMDGEK
jgi:hypothetical protein